MKGSKKNLAILALIVFAVLVVSVGITPPPAYAATIVVNTADDNETAGDGNCTLREAINNANAGAADTTEGDCVTGTAGLDTINFSGNLTISLLSILPLITEPVIIDGSAVDIILDGSSAGSSTQSSGLRIFAAGAGSTVKGLVITGFFFSRRDYLGFPRQHHRRNWGW